MKDYGPLRLYWEGGNKGEGLLQYIKPLVTQGTHKPTFPKTLLTKYYKDRFLQHLLKIDLKEEDREDGENTDVQYTKFRTYNNINMIETAITNGDSVSLIIQKDYSLCVSFYDTNKEHRLCNVITDDDCGEIVHATYVTKLSLGHSKTVEKHELTTNSNVDMFGLALPLKQKNDNTYLYYIITDNWKERIWESTNRTISFVLPRVNGCKY